MEYKKQLMKAKMELMISCYNDHPPQARTEKKDIINNEPKYTLGARIKKNDKSYQEIATRDKIEKDVITDTYNILTKDEQELTNYKMYFSLNEQEQEFLFIEFEGKDKLNEYANPRLKYNTKNRSFVVSKANENKLSEWDKEDIIENIKRITEWG